VIAEDRDHFHLHVRKLAFGPDYKIRPIERLPIDPIAGVVLRLAAQSASSATDAFSQIDDHAKLGHDGTPSLTEFQG
jgi:hypothetical protein